MQGGAVMLELDRIICGDCLEELPKLEANSVDLILTDPPYYKVKGEAWDNQWENPAKFLDWIGQLCQEWQRVLKPNGSLYVFASPKMAARVECKIAEYFNILNRITWRKNDGTANGGGLWSRSDKDILRRFFEQKEEIIFAEHYGSDNIAKGEAGYGAKCDELRGFVFEPIRKYLADEWKRAGLKNEDANIACGTKSMAARHFFSHSQWCLPIEEHYKKLQEYANRGKEPEYLRREYEDLRREYEDLRREYEDLRRPFSVTSEVPYTDVWDFPTVQYYEGKHPCEKPIEMLRHIITASSRPGAVVLDCFGGSCKVVDACIQLGRRYLAIEKEPEYVRSASKRVLSINPDAARKRIASTKLDRWEEDARQ